MFFEGVSPPYEGGAEEGVHFGLIHLHITSPKLCSLITGQPSLPTRRALHLPHRLNDVIHVRTRSEHHVLSQPQGFLLAGILASGTMHLRVIDPWFLVGAEILLQKIRLPVNRQEVAGRKRNPFRLHRTDELLPRPSAESIAVVLAEVKVVAVARFPASPFQRLKAFDFGKFPVQAESVPVPNFRLVLQARELGQQERGLQFAKTVVPAENAVLVPSPPREAPAVVQRSAAFGQFLVVGGDDAAFARVEVLGGLEAERTHVAEGAGLASLPFGAVRMGGILDYHEMALLRDGVDPVHVRTQATHVYRDDRLGTRRDGLLNEVRVQVVGVGVDVHEDRRGVAFQYGGGGGDEGVGRHNHLIAFANARRPQGQLQSHAPVDHGDAEAAAHILRKFLLELPVELAVQLAPAAAVERLQDHLPFAVVEDGPFRKGFGADGFSSIEGEPGGRSVHALDVGVVFIINSGLLGIAGGVLLRETLFVFVLRGRIRSGQVIRSIHLKNRRGCQRHP